MRDRHDVLPLRQPQRRVASVRDDFFEHEVAAFERQHRVAGGVGRRRKAGFGVRDRAPDSARCLSVGSVALRRGECRADDHRHQKAITVWFGHTSSIHLRSSGAVVAFALSARDEDGRAHDLTRQLPCPAPPVQLCRVRPASSLPNTRVTFPARCSPAADGRTADMPAACDS